MSNKTNKKNSSKVNTISTIDFTAMKTADILDWINQNRIAGDFDDDEQTETEKVGEIEVEFNFETSPDRLENVESNFGKIKGKIDQAAKARWLEKAIVQDGKYIVQVEKYAGLDTHPNWHPVYYLVNTDFTKTRIGLEVAYELYTTGKVVGEISDDNFKALQKEARKAKTANKKESAKKGKQ